MTNTKNNKTGSGPVSGLTVSLSCCCKDSKEFSTAEKNKWNKLCKTNPSHKCLSGCPFQIISDYLSLLPDPFGSENKALMVSQKNSEEGAQVTKPLKFMRARTTVGALRNFILGNLGISMYKDIFNRVNMRFPEDLRVSIYLYL